MQTPRGTNTDLVPLQFYPYTLPGGDAIFAVCGGSHVSATSSYLAAVILTSVSGHCLALRVEQ